MQTVYIFSDHMVYTEESETMEHLKRIVLNVYNVDQFTYSDSECGSGATTFRKFFSGVKASKK